MSNSGMSRVDARVLDPYHHFGDSATSVCSVTIGLSLLLFLLLFLRILGLASPCSTQLHPVGSATGSATIRDQLDRSQRAEESTKDMAATYMDRELPGVRKELVSHGQDELGDGWRAIRGRRRFLFGGVLHP